MPGPRKHEHHITIARKIQYLSNKKSNSKSVNWFERYILTCMLPNSATLTRLEQLSALVKFHPKNCEKIQTMCTGGIEFGSVSPGDGNGQMAL